MTAHTSDPHALDVLFIGGGPEPANTFAESLGVARATNDWGREGLDVSETGGTSIAGLHVIGDARTGFGGLIAAAAEGAACAEMIVHEIATERWTRR
jgi:thioredoxin reductase